MRISKLLIPVIFFSLSTAGFAQQSGLPFADEIRAFRMSDSINPPPKHEIVFAGSSSFTIWKDVQDYFPDYTIINRGFGGSTLSDQLRYADQIILPWVPKQIVIYCGENDFAYDDKLTPEAVTERFKQLFTLLRTNLPDTKITYVSIKPSLSRWNLAPKFQKANKEICKFLKKQPNTSFVNIWNKMLNDKHVPDKSLFLEDMLHMNANGYKIWQKAIKPELIR
jgi:lysophospholipase L1-like esterase